MISPHIPEREPEAAFAIRESCDAFFGADGPLARSAGEDGFAYEPRPQQKRMADAVASAMENRRHLIVEAGTGVGKSFAYLVPAVLAALEKGCKVIISTYTISLQEQLIRKDIPRLRRWLGRDFKAVLVKGKGNYLCLRRLARAESMSADLFRRDGEAELERLRAFALEAREGTRQELEELPRPDVWNAVNVEQGNCMWQRCPEYGACFYMRARREIQDAHIVIVNHHLFFSDLSLRMKDISLLPDSAMVILDEAHALEDVAAEHMGIRLSHFMCEHWFNRMHNQDTGKGILAALKAGTASHQVSLLRRLAGDFFADMAAAYGLNTLKTRTVIDAVPTIETDLVREIGRMLGILRELHDDLEDLDMRAELSAVRRRGADIAFMLEAFMSRSFDDHVYWIELEGRHRKQPVLYSAPIEVGPLLKEHLFDRLDTVVMTSATLAVGGKLDYFAGRTGAGGADQLSVGTPFDYARQMTVHIPDGMPDPKNTDAYIEATARAVEHYTDMTGGRAFVLFTNARHMKLVHDRCEATLRGRRYDLFLQNDGLSREAMLERFRNASAGVLFGLNSFWMGVDIQGEALSNVIITRLPFAVPNEPVVKARMQRIEERGGDPFKEFSLPEAVLRFRQGAGRLIRSVSDRGILVVLDARIRTRWYGRAFLADLRECEIVSGRPFVD